MSEAQKRTPRPAPQRLDAKSFPLSPTDGFVLSRVDGTLNEADLTASTGLPEAQVQASLTKLETLGLIVFDGGPPAPGASATTTVALRTSSVHIRAAAEVSPRPAQKAAPAAIPAAPSVARSSNTPSASIKASPLAAAPLTEDEQASLAEDVDLDPVLRRQVIDAHRSLDRRDHYALLGIEESADRKAIKRAYYELAAAFHPDRYFRKRLGSFKVRMEAVFARLTIAHDTLSDKEKRSDYGAYLAEQRIAQAIEENLARGLTQAEQVEESVERAVHADVPISSAPPPLQVEVAARRDALARRLLGGTSLRPSALPASGLTNRPGPQAPTPAAMPAADAMNALRRRYEERVAGAKASEARRFSAQAEAALASGDLVTAATAFRAAANLAPDNAELGQKATAARVKANALLSHTYTRQARYEEAHDQWSEAARSWARVCRGSPDDGNAHERAAHAVLKSDGDLHDGARFAQRACTLDPTNPIYRITLASCYAAAGLALNAQRELDTAAQLAPHDDKIEAMIKRVGQPA